MADQDRTPRTPAERELALFVARLAKLGLGIAGLIAAGTVALSHGGVAFDSIDGEPVYVFVLLVSPQDRPGDHLRALENVVRTMRDDAFVKALRQADSKDAVWALLGDSAGQWDR